MEKNAERTATVIRDQRVQFGRRVTSVLQTIREPVILESSEEYIKGEELDVDVLVSGTFHGTIQTTKTIEVRGHVRGFLKAPSVIIAKGGRVEGDIEWNNSTDTDVINRISVEGEVVGNVCMKEVFVKNAGIIHGSVTAEAIVCSGYGSEISNGNHKVANFIKIKENAIVLGDVEMDSAIMLLFES